MPAKRIIQTIFALAIPVGVAAATTSLTSALPASQPGVLSTQDSGAWVNIRSAPTVDASAVEQGYSGESVEILRATQGGDGYTWYYVRSSTTRAEGWVRGDLVRVGGAAVRSLAQSNPPATAVDRQGYGAPDTSDDPYSTPFPEYRPVPATTAATSPNPFVQNQASSVETTRQPQSPSNAALSRASLQTNSSPRNSASSAAGSFQSRPQSREFVFEQQPEPAPAQQNAALVRRPAPQAAAPVVQPEPSSAETAWVPSTPRTPVQTRGYTAEQIQYFLDIALGAEFGETGGTIRKWTGPVRVKVNGTPTREDLATLNSIVNELNDLVQGAVPVQLTNSNPNIEIYFAPEAQFSSIEPNYRARNLGFFWAWWDGGTINRARILISTTGVTQQERSHLIREELTQSIGLMQDSTRYRDSIFYQGWTDVTQYSAIDRVIISMLYSPAVRPGMSRPQVLAAIRQTGDRSASACGVELPLVGWRVGLPWQSCNVQ